MNPSVLDVWEILSDSVLDLKEKYGEFTNRFGTDKDIVDFDDLDICIDFGKNKRYEIGTERDYAFTRGDRIDFNDRKSKIDYEVKPFEEHHVN